MPITPFVLAVPDGQLDDLRDRLRRTRWPNPRSAVDWDRGVPGAYAMSLTDYWLDRFDWRRAEAWLNQVPQGITEVEGQPIHFFHSRSRHPDALPLMLLHGWPSSGVEFVGMLDRLTDPERHGGSATDAFHVIVPTTPGFGLSGPLQAGWDAVRTAQAYQTIVQELGYRRWGVHGGDVGADIAGELNHLDGGLVGVHMSTDLPSIIWFAGFLGRDLGSDPSLTDADRRLVAEVLAKGAEDGGYLEIQRTRPSTVGYLLNDSPVGQLAWITEKFKNWTGDGTRLPEMNVDLDHLLTIVSLAWFTGAGADAAQFLCTNLHARRDWGRPSHAPVGMAVFGARGHPRAIHDPERRLSHWTECATGGHFPAMEVPELLVADLRTFFGPLRAGAPT